MSSRCHSAAPTTRICIGTATRRLGGQTCRSRQCLLPNSCGTRARAAAKKGPRYYLTLAHINARGARHMNANFNTAPTFALPAELDSLSPPPLLLPGESLEKYELMRHAI